MSIPCIVITKRADALADFLEGLAESGELAVEVAADGAAAVQRVKAAEPGLVVVDEAAADGKPFALVVAVVMANALFNTAVITAMDAETYEDKSEGFGVLCAVPFEPDEADGRKLSRQAVGVLGAQ